MRRLRICAIFAPCLETHSALEMSIAIIDESTREEDGGPKCGVGSLSSVRLEERRRKPRIFEYFPVKVRGMDANGEAFELDATLDNLSAGGLYMRLTRRMEADGRLFIVIRLSAATTDKVSAPHIAVRGRVVRAEQQSPGTYGLAIAFTRHRFL
jgi:hypothetical protein